MKVLPTLEGGLRVELEDEQDWSIFQELLDDARGRREDWLAKRLGVLMEEEDWETYVIPDLAAHFGEQVGEVAQALADAKKEADGYAGELFIARKQGEAWYGVLNQARLALEGEWKFGGMDEAEGLDWESEEPAKVAALMRSQLYLLLQSQLMEFVLDSGGGE
ncbi:MAG: hypothetical protein AAGC74_14730 [Verrucomicrobiota bacterium]